MPLSVVIIEDSEAERFFLRRAILKCRPNSTVVEFSYARDALDHLSKTPAHVIFLDINMPLMDGFAFADAYGKLPVSVRETGRLWMVSHSIDPLDREQAEAHPAITGFLSKNYQKADIDRVLPHINAG